MGSIPYVCAYCIYGILDFIVYPLRIIRLFSVVYTPFLRIKNKSPAKIRIFSYISKFYRARIVFFAQ